LKVLYLYDNDIEEAFGVEVAVQLTHLYLQNNALTRTIGMMTLRNLTKLCALVSSLCFRLHVCV
jgi:hypothetical protein